MGERLDQYRWGPFMFEKGVPWIEPLTLLSAIAGATNDIRLVTGVLIAPLRPPALLAKIVATLDQLSRGRLDLGVGTGWQPAEYDAMGLDFAKRAQMLDDTIAACRDAVGPEPDELHVRRRSRSSRSGAIRSRSGPVAHRCSSRARSRRATCAAS